MTRLAIIVGSTRPARRGRMVADWVADIAAGSDLATTGAATFDVIDLADVGLPLLDEPAPAAMGDYRHAHTRTWAATVNAYDGFVFVTAEYNHAAPAVVKNSVDYLFGEWNDKAAGFVSYGVHGGVRAVEQLRLAMTEVKVASVRTQLALSLSADFEITDPLQPGIFAPREHQAPTLLRMLDELTTWAAALQPLRVTHDSAATSRATAA